MKRDTIEEAERIGLSPKTLENWRSLGCGPPYYKIGARVVYDEREVDEWLAARRRNSTAKSTKAQVAA
jgi:predicted DNA-binding transcriptional regulator AlpA